MARIITKIIMDDNGGEIRTVTRDIDSDNYEACERRSIVFAIASVCRESPLGFEKCLEGLEREAMAMSKTMGKRK